jgi:hypothetical protein
VAILDDLLPDVIPASSLASMPQELRTALIYAFTQDFLAYFHDERQFWLPARTAARWVHGYLREARTAE